jgi:hypothetical protein
MIFIELPCLQQFIYHGLLLTPACSFWDVSWVFHHSFEVEVRTDADEKAEYYVQYGSRFKRP